MIVFACLLLPLRFIGVITTLIAGLIAQITLFAWVKPRTARRIVSAWSKTMLLCLGVKMVINRAQRSTQNTALVVSNHISWLDILALQAACPVVFVAKSDIQSWPVLGKMVELAGTCFIDRSRRTALRTVHSTLTAHLQACQSVCIFPEGTTSNGLQVLPFHAGLLQAAIESGVPVQPVRLSYSHPAAAYIDDMTLVGSLLSILLAPRLSVSVQIRGAITSTGQTRQSLGLLAYEAVARQD